MNLFAKSINILDKMEKFIIKRTFWIILILVPTVIMSTFFLTTCSITCQVEKANNLQQEEKKYRDNFIHNYEQNFKKQQLQLKDSLVITKDQQAFIDSIHNLFHEEKKILIDSLFIKWEKTIEKKHNNLVLLGESSNLNFSIWLAIIAAICTILPVVLALHQTQNFNSMREDFKEMTNDQKKTTDKDINLINNKINDFNNKINKQSTTLEQVKNRIEITMLLDIVTQNLNILINIQELENSKNIHLTSLEEVKFYSNIICETTQRCMNKFSEISSNIDDKDNKIIFNASMCTLCTLRDALCRFENVLKGKKLIVLQRVRYEVGIKIDELVKNESPVIDKINTSLGAIHGYTSLFKNLFKELS